MTTSEAVRVATAPSLDAIRGAIDADAIRARIRDLDRERELLRELLGTCLQIDGRKAAKAYFAEQAAESAHAG